MSSGELLASPATTLALYAALVLGLTGALLVLSSWVGQKRPGPEKLRAYESGVLPTGPARLERPVPFYLVAVFFLVFDVEGVFLFSWAVCFDRLGWAGWFQAAFFVAVLLVGLAYVWRKGGLAWPTHCSRP